MADKPIGSEFRKLMTTIPHDVGTRFTFNGTEYVLVVIATAGGFYGNSEGCKGCPAIGHMDYDGSRHGCPITKAPPSVDGGYRMSVVPMPVKDYVIHTLEN